MIEILRFIGLTTDLATVVIWVLVVLELIRRKGTPEVRTIRRTLISWSIVVAALASASALIYLSAIAEIIDGDTKNAAYNVHNIASNLTVSAVGFVFYQVASDRIKS